MNFRNPDDLKLTDRPVKKSEFSFPDLPVNPETVNPVEVGATKVDFRRAVNIKTF